VAATTGTQDPYAAAVGRLWSGLSPTLRDLDETTGDLRALQRLQYALHVASEDAYGLEPPPDAASAHAELAAALASARDATADVAEACRRGGAELAQPLLYEWRGALFRVRLARMRLAPPAPRAPRATNADDSLVRPAVAFLLALGGALAFVAGATLAVWPLWAAGLVAVCASLLAYRP
jgi:hypothetical protein